MEEFGITVVDSDVEEFGTFCHPAAGHDNKTLCMEVFMVKSWVGEITPDNEVEELLWLTSVIPAGKKVGSVIAEEVIPRLKQTDLID